MTTKKTNSKTPAVIIRTYSAGVHFGYLTKRTGREVELVNARRIWSWCGANTLNEIATRGVGKGSKISERTPGKIVLTEAIEVIDCAPEAVTNLEAATWG